MSEVPNKAIEKIFTEVSLDYSDIKTVDLNKLVSRLSESLKGSPWVNINNHYISKFNANKELVSFKVKACNKVTNKLINLIEFKEDGNVIIYPLENEADRNSMTIEYLNFISELQDKKQ